VVLKNDEHESVFVSEVQEVDFGYIDKHLQKGDSIFITSVPSQKPTTADHQEMSIALNTLRNSTKVPE
jgi:hypothetical protein